MTTKVRTNTRLEVTSEQSAFIKKAVKAQLDSLEALTEWPAIIPYSKEYVVGQHTQILANLDDLSKPVEVKTRAPRAAKVAGATAAPNTPSKNGAARAVSA